MNMIKLLVSSIFIFLSACVSFKSNDKANIDDSHFNQVSKGLEKINFIEEISKKHHLYSPQKTIHEVAIIVIVDSEILTLVNDPRYALQDNQDLTQKFIGLAKYVKTGRVITNNGQNLKVHLIKVADSHHFPNRHVSGYTYASALAALTAREISPDLVISFGTAGGKAADVNIGDGIIGSSLLFIDRIRTSSQAAFEWGILGGTTMQSHRLIQNCSLKEGIIASQIAYAISPSHKQIIDRFNIKALDMEAAAEAEVFNKTQTNFIAIKVISNGIYPDDPSRMEEEYLQNRTMVSSNGAEILRCALHFIAGKKLGDL